MSTLLIIVVVILGVIALSQLIRVFELASRLKGDQDPGEVPERSIRANATGMLVFVVVFLVYTIGLTIYYSDKLLPEAASEHGATLDTLLNFNFVIIGFVFIVTHILLFWFTYKYAYNKNRKATYFTHSNKLELIWTVVPAIFLAVIIVFGLSTWNDITKPAPDNALTVELYARQFDWTARYTGPDTTLGTANYRFAADYQVGMDPSDEAGHDDILVKGEFHIPKDKPVNFVMRSQDVIHSAYMPHFRAQMNCVPGMVTNFHFVPTISTKEMREKTGDPDFNYYLLCNKICGAAHYNMKMIIIVDDNEETFDTWLAEQGSFKESLSEEDFEKFGIVADVENKPAEEAVSGEESDPAAEDAPEGEADAENAEAVEEEGGETASR